MFNHHLLTKTAYLLLTAALSGCAGSNLTDRQKEINAQAERTVLQRQQAAITEIRNAERNRRAAQEVNKPFIAGNAIPLDREIRMPEALRKDVVITGLFSSQPVDLLTAASQVSQSAGIVVSVTPDALQSASAFSPKTAATSTPVQAPPKVLLKVVGVPIWRVLDDITNQTQTSWRPTQSGAEIFRVETRVYDLYGIPQTATTSAALGRSGGGGGAFDSQSKSAFELKGNSLLAGVVNSIEALLTTGGKTTFSPESQSLVVTDTPAAHARIDAFVKEKNKALGRRIRVLIEAIDVAAKEGSDLGIDWNLVYNTTASALTSTPVTNTVNPQAGQFNFAQSLGRFTGSSMVVRALNEVGTVVNRRVFPVITTSGRPVTQAVRSTFNYVDQVQQQVVTSSASSVQSTPSVTQKDETVGTFVTIVPTAKDNGTIIMSVAFDTTSLDSLKPYTVGSGASAVTVQQKTISGSGIIQEVPVLSGKTEVIGGVELLTSSTTDRRLADGAPMVFGGSDSRTLNKSVTVFLVTAVTEEGI